VIASDHKNASGFAVTQRKCARTNSHHNWAWVKQRTALNNDFLTGQKANLLQVICALSIGVIEGKVVNFEGCICFGRKESLHCFK
jgi:hypothetical protein